MNKKVYTYFFATYGKAPGYWFGVITEIYRTLAFRTIVALVLGSAIAAVAKGDTNAAVTQVGIYIIVMISALIIGAAGDMFASRAENNMYGDILERYYKKLTGKDMAFYKDNQTGYLAATFRQHLDGSLSFARLLRGEVLQTVVSLVVPVGILLVLSWQVGLVALGIIVIQAMYVFWVSTKATKYREITHKLYRQLSGAVSDDITNIVAYKSAANEALAYEKVHALRVEEVSAFQKRRRISILFDLPRGLITALGTAFAYWVVIHTSNNSAQAVSLMVITLTYMFQIFRNVDTLPNVITNHDDLITKILPTLEYLTNEYETIIDPVNVAPVQNLKGTITTEHVAFMYGTGDNTKQVISNLTITIPAGQQVGVVGLSGAGKSTFASLLMRFDDVTGGRILLDGHNIRDMRQQDVRGAIAYVPQEPLLFHKSIRENIAYFNPNASQAKIIAAAKAAHAHDFIEQLTQGYDTLVGERGIKLSGGQKQRIVIARAVLKDAPIMLFDEATSALDSHSEKIIQAALPEIIGKRTAIVIAHRLSTVAGLDRIIVMHKGTIIEDGTHSELLALQGQYYALWQKQTAAHSLSPS